MILLAFALMVKDIDTANKIAYLCDSAIFNICPVIDYEAQAAVELEALLNTLGQIMIADAKHESAAK